MNGLGPHLPGPPTLTEDSATLAALAHLYRGEMNRMTVWRERLDVTSNWAILLSVGLTTFTLGAVEVPHYTLLLGLAVIAISILLEGRRYRHLFHSKWRLYLLESGLFAELLDPGQRGEGPPPFRRWQELLATDLRRTRYEIGLLTAVRVRLRRNYLLLLYFIYAVWAVKLFIHPQRAETPLDLWSRLQIGGMIPSWFVACTATLFLVVVTLLALTCPSGETMEDWGAREHPEPNPLPAQPPGPRAGPNGPGGTPSTSAG